MPLNNTYKHLFLLAGLLITTINLCAWSVSDYYLGNPTISLSPRNAGMGNTGVFDAYSPFTMSINPANVTNYNGKLGFGTTGLFTRNEDSRSLPLYNSFDAFIDDATYSSNINLYDDWSFAGYGKYRFNKLSTAFGIHYLPVVNFKGDYDEEVRNNRNSDNDTYPEIIAINKINNNGKLNALGFTIGGGWDFGPDLNAQLGVTLNNLSGKSEVEKSIKWSNWAMQQSINLVPSRRNMLKDSLYTNVADLSGTQLKIGTAWKLNSRIGIGIAHTFKSEMDRDSNIRIVYGPDTTMVIPSTSVNLPTTITSNQVKDKYILPSKTRVGFTFYPRNIMKTQFNAEVEYVQWTDLCNQFDDSWNMHFGVEHSVTNRMPLRLGFQSITEWQAYPDYNNLTSTGKPTVEVTKIITPAITAGSSVELVKNVVLDFGLSFSWREYQALDMFRDGYYNDKIHTGMTSYILWPNSFITPTDRKWDNPDKVRESFTQISTGITWTW